MEIQISDRQLEVLRLIAQGNTNSAVAKRLNISRQTVDKHLSKLYNQLRPYYGSPRTRIIIYAHQRGLLDDRISESGEVVI